MKATEAAVWVQNVCVGLRRSQTKTLAAIVTAALQLGRTSLAELGRLLAEANDQSAKHTIKRVWRFTSNTRVHVGDAMQGPLAWLFRGKAWKKRPLLVSFDWTEVRNFHTLMAAAVIRGRGIPLLWASYPEWELHKSQNNLEEGLLRLLKTMLPEGMRVILLADRGFGRTELARTCQQLGFQYVIRIRPDVHIECREHRGLLSRLPVKRGTARLLRQVAFRKKDSVTQHVVVYWKKGLPKKRDECWFLMTDLDRTPQRLTDLYGRRMTIEELFRDGKNRRYGWALRNTLLRRADRFDRLLLVLALAYLLLVGIGLIAQATRSPGEWCSSNRQRACGVFFIGRKMLRRVQATPAEALAALVAALLAASRKWG
jgi:hypothetical protein